MRSRVDALNRTDVENPGTGDASEVLSGQGGRLRLLVERPWIGVMVFVGLGFLVHLVRIANSPDVVYDETVYTRAALNVVHLGRNSWDTGPVFIHPPIFFLLEGAWLWLVAPHGGTTGAALFEAVYRARILTGAAAAVDIGVVYLFATRFCGIGEPRRRARVAVVAATLALVDPVLVHYGRAVLIEPVALLGIFGVLFLAWSRMKARPVIWVATVGLACGVSLLTKELSGFWLLTPVVYGALRLDWRIAGRGLAAFAVGVLMWVVTFMGWAASLGQLNSFVSIKFYTFQRLIGVVQTTGLNRAGISPTATIVDKAPLYAPSYALLVAGGLASLGLLIKAIRSRQETSPERQFLVAALVVTYAFAAYTIVIGQLNEQFFVYVMPFAAVAVATAFVTANGRATAPLRALAWAALLVVVADGAVNTVRVYVLENNRGFVRLAAAVRSDVPPCNVINSSGEIEPWEFADPANNFIDFAEGQTALSAGVEYFLLSPKGAKYRYPNMSPELQGFIQSRGTLMASFASRDYSHYMLYRVTPSEFDPTAALTFSTTGVPSLFAAVGGSNCGGFAVTNDAGGLFFDAYGQLGGPTVVGRPASQQYDTGTTSYQLLDTLMLSGGNDQATTPSPAPIVARLEASRPDVLTSFDLPTRTVPLPNDPAAVSTLLTDVGINLAYLGVPKTEATANDFAAAASSFGLPLGPPEQMRDGYIRQPFQSAVLERAPDALGARRAIIAPAVIAAGFVPASAQAVQGHVPVVHTVGILKNADVVNFLELLGGFVVVWTALTLVTSKVLSARRAATP